MSQRQLVVAVEATGALGAFWPVLLSEYVEKIVRAFVEDPNSQRNGSPGEMALVVFSSKGQHAGCLPQQSGWTSSVDVFFKWLSAIEFGGGGFNDAAVAEALAESLMMCCPGPKPPGPAVSLQKHCLLVAASNPYRLPTPVIRPPILILPNGQPELQSEQWWLADAEAVAKAFPPVSLSVIAPRQLLLLRSIFNGAKRNPRVGETISDASKQQHLVLISEGFPEGKGAIRRAAVASNTAAPSSLSAKLEPLLTTTTSAPPQPAAVRPSLTGLGRQAISNGASSVSVDNQSLLHSNVTAVPLSLQHPSTSGVSGADTMQTSDNSASSQAKVGPVAGNPSTLGHISNTLTQTHKIPGATTLGSVANGGPVGLSSASVNNPTASGLTSLTSGQATILPGTASVLTGLGTVTSSAGMNTGIGHSAIGGGTLSANANTNANTNIVGPTGSLVTNQLGPSAVAPLQAGVGQLPVSGAGQPQSNPLGVIAGIGGTTSALGTAGVNAGVNAMPPTSGLPQPVQPVQPVQPLGPPGLHGVAQPPQPAQSATPPQQSSGALKYTKLWEGILAGQRQQKPVPICKLEGYRQTSASEKLAADWPPTMQIVRLIAQDYMNSKEYQGKAELLVFRPLSSHGFLVQLAEKKLCAVIQLPSQTLLLASTDKPGRMIGMLFPGRGGNSKRKGTAKAPYIRLSHDMVVFKPNVSTSAQQPTGAVAPMAGTGQAMGQTLGQSNFSQGQLQSQMNPQQLNAQQMSAQQMNPQQLNAQQMSAQQQLNAQQIGVQQMNAQQLNAQQMNPQQLNAQQMSVQQMNPQQMNVQQINPQQMNVQHMNPQQINAQQMNPQQTRPQIIPGPVSLQGSGYLP